MINLRSPLAAALLLLAGTPAYALDAVCSSTTICNPGAVSTPGGALNGASLNMIGSTVSYTLSTSASNVQAAASTLLPMNSVAGLVPGMSVIYPGTSVTLNIPPYDTISSIAGTAEISHAANGSFLATQKVIPMAVTDNYLAGMQCTDTTTAAIGAGNLIASVQTGVSITLTSNTLTNSSGSSDTIVCSPVITLSAASTGIIPTSSSIKFYAATTVGASGTTNFTTPLQMGNTPVISQPSVPANPTVCVLGAPCILGVLRQADFNSTADQPIVIAPLTSGNTGYLGASASKYQILAVWVDNCTSAVSTAAGGFYTTTSKGGTPFVAAAQTYANCTSSTTMQQATLASIATTTVYSAATLYLSLTTGKGSAVAGDVYIYGIPFN